MKLPRPYIPLRVRVQVAERQFYKVFGRLPDVHGFKNYGQWLRVLLSSMFGNTPVELHHRPALCNREWLGHLVVPRYVPDANDPDYLVYLPAGPGSEHDIETRVRGQHGQHSDLGLARKRKRIERKAKRPKRKWPSRPFPKKKAAKRHGL